MWIWTTNRRIILPPVLGSFGPETLRIMRYVQSVFSGCFLFHYDFAVFCVDLENVASFQVESLDNFDRYHDSVAIERKLTPWLKKQLLLLL